MINERQQALTKTMSFLRSIKRAYGDEKAMDVWSEVSKIINDDELTMAVMHSLLSGGYVGQDIVLLKWTNVPHGQYQHGSKVPAIKAFRAWTGCGLKEAKDAIEAAENGQNANQKFKIAKRYWQSPEGEDLEIPYQHMMRDFEEVGIEVEIV